MKGNNITDELNDALGSFQETMQALQGKMMVIAENAKADLTPEEVEIIKQFEKDAVNLDIKGLEKLRDMYTENLKNGRK